MSKVSNVCDMFCGSKSWASSSSIVNCIVKLNFPFLPTDLQNVTETMILIYNEELIDMLSSWFAEVKWSIRDDRLLFIG